jgi:hypothetical protein
MAVLYRARLVSLPGVGRWLEALRSRREILLEVNPVPVFGTASL